MISNGGLAIHGGLLLGLITIIYLTKKRNIELFNLLDIISPSIILAQSIGRWGNYFNQEAYGSIVTKSFLKSLHIPNFIIENMKIEGAYHHPCFLYESILCLIGFIILEVLTFTMNSVSFLCSIFFKLLRTSFLFGSSGT